MLILNQLLLANFHFATMILSALVLFATGFLFFDSWTLDKKNELLLVRGIGFFMCSISYGVLSIAASTSFAFHTAQYARALGLLVIFASLLLEQVPKKPMLAAAFFIPLWISGVVSPLLSFLIAFDYFRKMFVGFQKELKPVATAFVILGLSQLVEIALLGSDSNTVFWSNLLSNYGIVSNLGYILLLISMLMLAGWVWRYLRFRFMAQLFVTLISASFAVFLIVAFVFSFILLKNIEDNALTHLNTDSKVMQYALGRLEEQTRARAIAISESNALETQLRNPKIATASAVKLMVDNDMSFLQIIDTNGKVVLQAEDSTQMGKNLQNQPLVAQALKGKTVTAIIKKDIKPLPLLQVYAAVPLVGSKKGVLLTGVTIDDAFVDGVKSVTGLDATVFSGNIRTATTLTASDGKTRFVGTEESSDSIKQTVLKEGQSYLGTATILNRPFYAAYTPMRTYDRTITGMLFIGELQTVLIKTLQTAINFTFMISLILMALSVIPAYFLSKFIAKQIES